MAKKMMSSEEWSERDSLPTRDPIGDIFERDQKKYMDEMKSRVLFPASKNFEISPSKANKCSHSKKRKVIISNNLKYWFCPDCKEDVGDIV